MASAELAVEAPAWLNERREKGAALVESIELPHAKTKGWEFTDISRLDLATYENSPAEVTISGGSEDVVVLPLNEALADHSDLLAEKLGSLVSTDDPFVARNEAALHDGVLVYVPRNVECEEAIKIDLRLDTDRAAVNWRTLVVLEEGATVNARVETRSVDAAVRVAQYRKQR